jgi:sugar/nucleoside kinase (ribokinase family)
VRTSPAPGAVARGSTIVPRVAAVPAAGAGCRITSPLRMLAGMSPAISAPRRLTRASRRPAADRPSVVVVGDLVMDVVLAPDRDIQRGTDVTGRVMLRQGGSAASTARWLGRLGTQASLICSIGRDVTGRALVGAMTSDRVLVHAVRVPGARTGRIGVFVDPGGQRSFVTERGAALRLRPEDLKREWFTRVDLLHLPAYSLLDQPLGRAGMAATRMAREAGALVTLDLSSSEPLLQDGRRAAVALVREAAPDLLFATKDEARALLGAKDDERLLDLAPIAVVKRGKKGATILLRDGKAVLRFEVATSPLKNVDTTGAGDAFDAGFLAAWLEARQKGLPPSAALQRGAVGGNRCAHRHLSNPPGELVLG